MELLIAIIVAAVAGLLIYSLTKSSESALEILDINKDGKINAEDAKQAVKEVKEEVKKVAKKTAHALKNTTINNRGRKPAAAKPTGRKKGA
jgi:polyhydroxyalkanoate synthesis regulator phasin